MKRTTWSCCRSRIYTSNNRKQQHCVQSHVLEFITARCYAERSDATASRLTIRLSVRPWSSGMFFSHRLEYFENNSTVEKLKAPAHIDPNVGDLVLLFNSTAMLSQWKPRDASVNFNKYRNLQRHSWTGLDWIGLDWIAQHLVQGGSQACVWPRMSWRVIRHESTV